MSDDRNRAESASVTPLTDMGQQALEALVQWQKLALDFAALQTKAIFEMQKSFADIAARNGAALADGFRKQVREAGVTAQPGQWLETFADTQKRLAGIVGQQTGAMLTAFTSSAAAAAAATRRTRQAGDWDQYKQRIRDRWDRFSDEDLDAIKYDRDWLANKLNQLYQMGIEEAHRQLDEFLPYGEPERARTA